MIHVLSNVVVGALKYPSPPMADSIKAANPIDGRRIQLHTKIAKSPAMIRFLDRIHDTYCDKDGVWIYLDNGPVHKSKLVRQWLAEHPNVKIRWMPPYSPALNPQELVGGTDRRKFLNNHQFDNARQLAMKLSWFVRKLEPTTVKRACSLVPIEALLSF